MKHAAFSRFLYLLLVLPILTTSCHNILGKRVRGNGNIRTEDRSVSDFKNVEVSGAAKVLVSQGDKPIIKVKADENLLQYIEVHQDGDLVVIRERNGYNLQPSDDIQIFVTTKVYNRISASGACDIIGTAKISNPEDLSMHVSGAGDIRMEVDAPRLTAKVTGSGSIDLKGTTKDVDLDLSGAGHAHCYDLLSENTKVDISGAGDAEVFASVQLDANVSGAGSVHYKGNATTVNQHVSGAGSVNKSN